MHADGRREGSKSWGRKANKHSRISSREICRLTPKLPDLCGASSIFLFLKPSKFLKGLPLSFLRVPPLPHSPCSFFFFFSSRALSIHLLPQRMCLILMALWCEVNEKVLCEGQSPPVFSRRTNISDTATLMGIMMTDSNFHMGMFNRLTSPTLRGRQSKEGHFPECGVWPLPWSRAVK